MEAVVCPGCGEENPARFRLCGFCGTPLAASLPPQEVRKPATFIFVDLKGSTALTERIDQEAMNEIKKRYFAVMAAQIERHGGTIEKYIGDAIMAVFGIPRAHEDDALRAVKAAYGMQQELVSLNRDFLRFYGVELANRTGVNTGEVVANTDPTANQQLATGDTVNVAARLEQAAPANEILIGETTHDLVRAHVTAEPVEPLELKGKSELVKAYRLVGLGAPGPQASASLQDAPLVGRSNELAALEASFRDAATRRACRIITVVGDPGVGKTRLVRDFTAARTDEAWVLRGRCLPYGDGITFWPLNEVAREAAGIQEEDSAETALARLLEVASGAGDDAAGIVDRVAAAIGLSSTPFPVSELFWGGRRLIETLAADRPVLMVVDDIHLAQPTFLEFLEHLVATSDGAAILVLATARHGLFDKRPDWRQSESSPVLMLQPLSREDAAGLADQLLGGTGLDDVTRAKVVRASDGNPLFIEQMVSMLVDKGLLTRVDGGWMPAADLADLAVPPTIQALLASRLDDLSREERAVVEPAAVIGQVFFEPAIRDMVPQPVRPAVPQHLGALDQKQFVARDDSDPDEETYRFRHGLIRDATYGSLLKRTRAQLHEQFVAWAEPVNRARGREQEFEEILGFHLEQSYRYRMELGPLDDAGRELGARAAAKLGAAGRRAFARGDLPAAIGLLRRAVAILDPSDPVGIDTRTELAEALWEAGEFGAGAELLDSAHAAAQERGDRRLAARARLARTGISLYAEEIPTGGLAAALVETEAALRIFEAADDVAGAARALRVMAIIHATNGRYDEAADVAVRMVDHATRAGDMRLASRAAAGYATVALAGPAPVEEVRERCTRLLEQVEGDRKAEATIMGALAVAIAMSGDFDAAREQHREARAILADLGRSVTAASTSIEAARIEILAGQTAEAERLLRTDDAELAALNERYFRSTITGLLANVLEHLGSVEEAERYAALTEELADEDDANSQGLWRTARAKLLARRGESAAAIALASAAVELAESTADIDYQGDVHADLGIVLRRLGDTEAAERAFRTALERYEAKGDVAAAGAVEALLAGTP